ncbi:hypothetical protein [Sphingobium cupriresistens]|nr:hypothetical protein [Sphingobium cupriresistens]
MKHLSLSILLMAMIAGCGDNPAPSPEDQGTLIQSPSIAAPDPYDAKTSAPSGFKLPAGKLTNIALGNWAKTKRDSTGGDDFTKGFDDKALAGRDFTITIPLSQGDDETAAVWRYDKEKQELLLELDMEYTADLKGQMAVFQSAKDVRSPKQMANAFGVTVDVSQTTQWAIGVGTTSGYAGIIPSDALASSPDQKVYGYLTTTIKMPGDQARSAVAGMRLEIDGVVQKNRSGNTVECSERTTEPKIDQPSETVIKTCLIQAKFRRIAFVTKDGKALKEWRR